MQMHLIAVLEVEFDLFWIFIYLFMIQIEPQIYNKSVLNNSHFSLKK